jgi:hypothetical protein
MAFFDTYQRTGTIINIYEEPLDVNIENEDLVVNTLTEGIQGEKGDTGLQGIQGEKGDTGLQGVQGIQGEKGDKGDPGSDADVSKLEKKLNEFSDQVDKRLSKVAFNVAAKGGGGPAGSGEVLLHRLDDVDYASVKTPSNGQSLVWNSSTSKWKASSDVSLGTITVLPDKK